MAIIDAARRFGAELDLSDEAQAERDAIASALQEYAKRPDRPVDEYQFYGVIDKQSTNRDGNIVLQMIVGWDFHKEVFRALETMPFRAMINMKGLNLDDSA